MLQHVKKRPHRQWCDASRQRLASRQIFTTLLLVLDFGALALVSKVNVLALASVLKVSVLVRDQDTNLQRKMQHNTH